MKPPKNEFYVDLQEEFAPFGDDTGVVAQVESLFETMT
jgi:uncharacterized protein YfeS